MEYNTRSLFKAVKCATIQTIIQTSLINVKIGVFINIAINVNG